MNLTDAALALMWGLISGSALLVGSVVGLTVRLSARSVAAVMAFGSGILISVIAFDLMDEAFRHGGLLPTGGGFTVGAVLFTTASILVSHAGGRHRKRAKPTEDDARNAAAITIGTIIDDIPKSIVIGLSLIDGNGVASATVIAIFLSNIPEALSSSAGMKAAGRRPSHNFLLWAAIMALSGGLSLTGHVVFAAFPPEYTAATQSVGAGALLAMIADTMIPEAFAETHDAAGLIAGLGFLAGFDGFAGGNASHCKGGLHLGLSARRQLPDPAFLFRRSGQPRIQGALEHARQQCPGLYTRGQGDPDAEFGYPLFLYRRRSSG